MPLVTTSDGAVPFVAVNNSIWATRSSRAAQILAAMSTEGAGGSMTTLTILRWVASEEEGHDVGAPSFSLYSRVVSSGIT